MNAKIILGILALLFIVCAVLSLCSGCTTQPIIVDTGDIERLRAEYRQLREEYNRLQQDHQRLIDDQQFYADYYRNATAAIETGIRELGELGTDSLSEIARLRSYIAILRSIVNNILEGEQREGRQDTQADGDG